MPKSTFNEFPGRQDREGKRRSRTAKADLGEEIVSALACGGDLPGVYPVKVVIVP